MQSLDLPSLSSGNPWTSDLDSFIAATERNLERAGRATAAAPTTVLDASFDTTFVSAVKPPSPWRMTASGPYPPPALPRMVPPPLPPHAAAPAPYAADLPGLHQHTLSAMVDQLTDAIKHQVASQTTSLERQLVNMRAAIKAEEDRFVEVKAAAADNSRQHTSLQRDMSRLQADHDAVAAAVDALRTMNDDVTKLRTETTSSLAAVQESVAGMQDSLRGVQSATTTYVTRDQVAALVTSALNPMHGEFGRALDDHRRQLEAVAATASKAATDAAAALEPPSAVAASPPPAPGPRLDVDAVVATAVREAKAAVHAEVGASVDAKLAQMAERAAQREADLSRQWAADRREIDGKLTAHEARVSELATTVNGTTSEWQATSREVASTQDALRRLQLQVEDFERSTKDEERSFAALQAQCRSVKVDLESTLATAKRQVEDVTRAQDAARAQLASLSQAQSLWVAQSQSQMLAFAQVQARIQTATTPTPTAVPPTPNDVPTMQPPTPTARTPEFVVPGAPQVPAKAPEAPAPTLAPAPAPAPMQQSPGRRAQPPPRPADVSTLTRATALPPKPTSRQQSGGSPAGKFSVGEESSEDEDDARSNASARSAKSNASQRSGGAAGSRARPELSISVSSVNERKEALRERALSMSDSEVEAARSRVETRLKTPTGSPARAMTPATPTSRPCKWCPTRYPLSEIDAHEASCVAVSKQCVHCLKRFPVRTMAEHKASCPLRMVLCQYCGVSRMHRAIAQHEATCETRKRAERLKATASEAQMTGAGGDSAGGNLARSASAAAVMEDAPDTSGKPAEAKCGMCGDMVPSGETGAHEEECSWRQVRCRHCGMTVIQRDREKHEASCTEASGSGAAPGGNPSQEAPAADTEASVASGGAAAPGASHEPAPPAEVEDDLLAGGGGSGVDEFGSTFVSEDELDDEGEEEDVEGGGVMHGLGGATSRRLTLDAAGDELDGDELEWSSSFASTPSPLRRSRRPMGDPEARPPTDISADTEDSEVGLAVAQAAQALLSKPAVTPM